jgi:O-antigen/teichoic acid export membrane protein
LSRLSSLMSRARGWPHSVALASSLASGFGNQLMLIGSGVIFARLLGPEDRGYLALLGLWPAILWQLGSLGLPVSASYFIAQSPDRALAVVGRLARFASVQVVVLVLIHAAVILWFLKGRPSYLYPAAWISLGTIPLSLTRQYLVGVLQGQRRFTQFNIVRFLPSAFSAAGAVVMWLTGSRSLWAANLVLVVAAAMSLVFAAALAVGGLRTARSTEGLASFRQMLTFGLQSLPSSSYPVETFRLDQLFAGLALSPTALGIYVVAGSFSNLPRFAAQSIGLVSYPNVAAQTNRSHQRTSVWQFFWITAGLLVPMVLILIGLMKWLVPLFFGNQFQAAIPVAQVLLLAGIFLGVRRAWFEGLRGAGFPLIGTISEATSWLVLIPAMFAFASIAGVVGVAWAVLLSAVASFSLVLVAEGLLTRRGIWTVTKRAPEMAGPRASTSAADDGAHDPSPVGDFPRVGQEVGDAEAGELI